MTFEVEIWQHRLRLTTAPTLFSPRGPDAGTMAMLRQIELQPDDRVLDLGCGYGLVGLAVAKMIGEESVVMVDNDPVAVATARLNAEQNGLGNIAIVPGDGPAAVQNRVFSLILCNPPYHTDFSVARRLIEQSYRQLDTDGRLCLVVKRLDWYRNKLSSLFGGVTVRVDHGYFVLTAIKRNPASAVQAAGQKQERKTTKKHARRIEASQSRHRRSGRQ